MPPQTGDGTASATTCGLCGRSFARNEHLVRHVRTHTSEKPFKCTYCHRRVSRRDVLDKHMKTYHQPPAPPHDEDSIIIPSVRRARSRLACDECRRRKFKCDNHRPCDSCRTRSVPCSVSNEARPRGRQALKQSLLPGSEAGSMDVTSPTPPPQSGQEGAFLDTPVDSTIDASGMSPSDVCLVSAPQEAPRSASFSRATLGSAAIETAAVLDTLPDSMCHWANDPILEAAQEQVQVQEPSGPHQIVPDDVDFAFFNTIGDDGDMIELFSQLPGLDYENWLHDLDNAVSYTIPPNSVPEPMQNAISMMREHFQRSSRSASPLSHESNHVWYSAPPRFQLFDRDVMNVFLNLAKTQLGRIFKVLTPFEASEGVEDELVAAMAAVGGLFCNVEGSEKVVTVLYNDARKMVLAKTHTAPLTDFNSSLNRAKTFILLEIYGICSGDGRSYEFVEAFHGYLLQVVHKCKAFLPDDPISVSSMSALVEALHILECYRVLLLQRPPTFTALRAENLDPKGSSPLERERSETLAALMDLSQKYTSNGDDNHMATLATLSSFAWFPSPHCFFGWRDPSPWKTEFVEVALSQWIGSQSGGDVDPAALLLYHMAHIVLHANIGLIQRLSRLVVKCGRLTTNSKVFQSIDKWLRSRHYIIARWHAETLLKLITTSTRGGGGASGGGGGDLRNMNLSLTRLGVGGPSIFQQQEKGVVKPLMLEPPHLPFCAYFATIVLWYGCLLPGQSRLQRNACLVQGAHILFDLKVRVARNLGNALYELMAEDDDT